MFSELISGLISGTVVAYVTSINNKSALIFEKLERAAEKSTALRDKIISVQMDKNIQAFAEFIFDLKQFRAEFENVLNPHEIYCISFCDGISGYLKNSVSSWVENNSFPPEYGKMCAYICALKDSLSYRQNNQTKLLNSNSFMNIKNWLNFGTQSGFWLLSNRIKAFYISFFKDVKSYFSRK